LQAPNTLTAILCNYNHAPLVGRAIESLLSQSRPPDQLVIVDDGSSDNSIEVIESWANRSPRILFLRNPQNLGFHASSAKALAAATGHYVYNGAADDYILPGFFETVCGLMDRYPQAGIGCAKVVSVSPDGRQIRSEGLTAVKEARYLTAEDYLRQMMEVEPVTHSLSSGTIYRRDSLLQVGGWQAELGSYSDTFAIRAIGLQTGLCYVPQDGAIWLINPTGMSQTTRADPLKSWRIMSRAAELMKSVEFRRFFPAPYVAFWEAAMREALITQQLQPAIDGYQAVQHVSRTIASQSPMPVRWLLGLIRRVMTACYLLSNHIQRRVLRRQMLSSQFPRADETK